MGSRWVSWGEDGGVCATDTGPHSVGYRCYFCHVRCTQPGFHCDTMATLDHLTPKSKGGRRTRHNIVLACSSCNSKKRSVAVDEFLASDWLKQRRTDVALADPALS